MAGHAPTVREVRDAFGFSAAQTAQFHLEKLVEEGRLQQVRSGERGRSRGYRLPELATLAPMRMVPLLGRVQAGALTAAIEDPDGYIQVAGGTNDELFSLYVRGESMIDAGILPDDIVIVRRQPEAEDGQIVVALVDDEATVKRLRFRDGCVELHPENPAFEPIIPDQEALQILGRVVEVRRFL